MSFNVHFHRVCLYKSSSSGKKFGKAGISVGGGSRGVSMAIKFLLEIAGILGEVGARHMVAINYALLRGIRSPTIALSEPGPDGERRNSCRCLLFFLLLLFIEGTLPLCLKVRSTRRRKTSARSIQQPGWKKKVGPRFRAASLSRSARQFRCPINPHAAGSKLRPFTHLPDIYIYTPLNREHRPITLNN